jgi:hypothetical protein
MITGCRIGKQNTYSLPFPRGPLLTFIMTLLLTYVIKLLGNATGVAFLPRGLLAKPYRQKRGFFQLLGLQLLSPVCSKPGEITPYFKAH